MDAFDSDLERAVTRAASAIIRSNNPIPSSEVSRTGLHGCNLQGLGPSETALAVMAKKKKISHISPATKVAEPEPGILFVQDLRTDDGCVPA